MAVDRRVCEGQNNDVAPVMSIEVQSDLPESAKTFDLFTLLLNSATLQLQRENNGTDTMTKQVKIHYRRLRRDNDQFPAASLSDRIAAALEKRLPDHTKVKTRVTNRIADVPGHMGNQRVLNNFQIEPEYVFGTVCLFAPGQMQALLKLTGPDQAQAPLDAVLEAYDIAEKEAPEGHEYLHGVCYFLAHADHFYQIQSASLQAKAMEEYLTWLLRDKSGVIGARHYVELRAEFDRAQVGNEDDLTAIEIGGLVPETVRAPEPLEAPAVPIARDEIVDVVEHQRIAEAVRATFASAKQIMVDLLGPLKTEQIIASVPPEAALEVTVNIGYRSRKRKLRRAFMSELATGLRNLPDGEVKARGRNGEVRGDDVRLSQIMSIKSISDHSGLLDLQSARDQMLEVHRRFLHDGRIVE
jgi:hypothetical protein